MKIFRILRKFQDRYLSYYVTSPSHWNSPLKRTIRDGEKRRRARWNFAARCGTNCETSNSRLITLQRSAVDKLHTWRDWKVTDAKITAANQAQRGAARWRLGIQIVARKLRLAANRLHSSSPRRATCRAGVESTHGRGDSLRDPARRRVTARRENAKRDARRCPATSRRVSGNACLRDETRS